MTYPETGYGCHRCGMRFHVVDKFPTWGETTWCSTPLCNIRFHHCAPRHYTELVRDQPVRCEMLQSDLEEPAHG